MAKEGMIEVEGMVQEVLPSTLEISPYDATRGRINFRHPDSTGPAPARRRFPFKRR